MSLFAYLAGSDEAHRIRLGGMGLTTRADGSQGFGSIIFDDPDKTLTVRGWMKVVVHETACTSAPILFSGYIGPRKISRSNGSTTYKTGVSRFIDCALVDENVVLEHRLITTSDGKRPAEDHTDRITWLLSDGSMTGLIESDSLVDYSNPRPVDEADYRNQYPSNVLEDLASTFSKTFFVYVDPATGDRILFFDSPDAAVGTSTLSISNDLADLTLDANGQVTGDVFEPFISAEQNLDPSQVYSKDRYRYRNGSVIETNSATLAEFFTDNGLGDRAIALESTRVGLETTARSFAQRYLAAHANEKETDTLMVIVPKEKAGLIQAGQRIAIKMVHWDGDIGDDFTYRRIVEKVIAHADETNDLYVIAIEVTNAANQATGPSGGAPPPDDFPHQVTCSAPTLVQSKSGGSGFGDLTVTLDAAPTAGNTLVIAQIVHEENTTTAYDLFSDQGWSEHPDSPLIVPNPDGSTNAKGHIRLWYKTSDGTETAPTISVAAETELVVMEFAGERVLSDSDNDTVAYVSPAGPDLTPAPVGTVTVSDNDLLVSVAIWSTSAIGGLFATVDRGTVVDSDGGIIAQGPPWGVAWEAISAAGSASPIFTEHGTTAVNGTAGLSLVLSCTNSAAENPPSPGQPFGPIIPVETPDGSTTTFTLPAGYDFADGSLRVYVDRLDQTAAITSYDGAARTFTLAFAPATGELVEAYGQGR